ncbi:MAG: gliding motility-associated C-terminal domain-containing protein [Sporocytophaga sp.]|uniref:T9SS type B sorting domain-containing protein n=1 Tax=Sporocytophaga sp. TaxID=2231183 RepID=UPI001B2141A8|nr:gliding motility-associated C-terminal domain-containing protein [Sporocytophaga sp.]MBO9703550.1 gliding motility-associated C-terminal domain-containing protein [Sporocytophaga sp.]
MRVSLLIVIYILFFNIASASAQCIPANAGITYKDTCFSNLTQFTGIGVGDTTTWSWNFGDLASGTQNTAFGAYPTHTFSQTNTTYTVTFSFTDACGNPATITKNISIQNNPNPPLSINLKDTVVCDAPYLIDAGIPGLSYKWSDGDTTQIDTLNSAGKYWVKIYQNGCYTSDTVTIRFWGQGNKGDYNWHFGNNAGLNFNDNPPSVTNTNASSTNGGSASISDPSGNLLFYTDGINIYTKDNKIMQGGTGLKGNSDSSQSAIIVPDPRSNNIYYVFTVNPSTGLSYTTIDLSFNNGEGRVTNVNVPLNTPVANKISGMKDDQGNFWVVAHELNSNNFISYKIGTSGFSSTPVISSTGTVQTNGQGYMKFSKDGTKVAVALAEQNKVEIFDFNKNTGQLTISDTITNVTNPFGLEFSDDNNKLYVSTNGDGHLYQYDLTKATSTEIENSQVTISTDPSASYEALQLGPDGKIYVALKGSGSGFLGVINNPTLDSTDADYQHKSVDLGTESNTGLPNFVANYFNTSDWNLAYADTCSGSITLFQANAPDTVFTWTWSFGDGQTATGQTTTHTYLGPGTYNVSVRAIYACGDTTMSRTLTIVEAPPAPPIKDTIICDPITYKLDATLSGSGLSYLWSTGATSSFINTDTSGTYTVEVSRAGCINTATATVTFAPVIPFDLGIDKTLCTGDSIQLDAQNPGLTHAWSTGATSQSIVIKTSGIYSATVNNNGLCQKSDQITITFITPPSVSLGPDTTYCEGSSPVLDAGIVPSGFQYKWSTNEINRQIHPTTSGTYSVAIYSDQCQRSDTINIEFEKAPDVSLNPTYALCSENGDSVLLDGGIADSYLWLPGGQTTQSITVFTEGIYYLTAKSEHGCESTVNTLIEDICEARVFVPNIFSPNGDGNNDVFRISGANIISFRLEIFDQWGELIFVSNSMENSWNGEYRGTTVQEGAYIWKLTYTGESTSGPRSQTKTGDVTVIR